MFGPLGLPELIFIFVLALLVFGPKRLPEIGRTLGRALGEFRRSTNELKRTIETELTLAEAPPALAPPPAEPRAPRPAAPAEDGEVESTKGNPGA